jgi:hypothetical protein
MGETSGSERNLEKINSAVLVKNNEKIPRERGCIMFTLKIGQEIKLYFNNKEHIAHITQIDFGEIIWVRFEDKLASEEYYHMDELQKLLNPTHIDQMIEGIEDCLYN